MILDSSAVIAIIFKEPGFEKLVGKMAGAEGIGIGAPTLAETAIVLSAKLKADPRGLLARFLQEFEVLVTSFGEAHWREAVEAYRRYGRGHHPAGLNFGDCMSYAIAKLAAQPLLFVGRDFEQTDLPLA
jgi:ribonuclease VapC